MSYQETLDFLYSQLPMYQRVGASAFKKNLKNTRDLLKALGNPESAFPSIHVAGTNGKGSVTHMLGACYQAAGLRVGLYTSPHYRDFRERMKINGEYIRETEVIDTVRRMKSQILDIRPSFFEMTVAMAFDFFRNQQVDLAVIETGLGGRLDSTNVLRPLLSLITNIGFDHQQMLGNSLQEIAREKAGIIKRNTPVVIGTYQPKTAPVFRSIAESKRAQLQYADRQIQLKLRSAEIERICVKVEGKDALFPESICLDTGGKFQVKNIRTTLAAFAVLKDTNGLPGLNAEAIKYGLEHMKSLTNYIGRWQILGRNPLILADSAHNTHGLEPVLEEVLSLPKNKLHFVLGFVSDKDLQKTLKLFPENAVYYFARPDIPRGLDTDSLVQTARGAGRAGKAYHSVNAALAAAKKNAGKNDLIYVGGSSFVVAEVI